LPEPRRVPKPETLAAAAADMAALLEAGGGEGLLTAVVRDDEGLPVFVMAVAAGDRAVELAAALDALLK
jgi:hypothetical protein